MIGTVEGFVAYAVDRGSEAAMTASPPAARAALVRASDHITHAYVARFAPGHDATSPNVEAATYEAAMIELQTPGFFSSTRDPNEPQIIQAGDIRWQPVAGGQAAAPVSPRIEAMLAPYLLALPRIMVV